MHEFDRFVRHQLRPQAYVRYGDDFLLFWPTRQQAYQNRVLASDWLASQLKLVVNPSNDVVIAAAQGLRFCGHDITEDSVIVDAATSRAVLSKLERRNIASYKSLYLADSVRKQLDWQILDINSNI